MTDSNGPGNAVEELIEDPNGVVASTGYAESKWIAECILAAASEKTGLCTLSVRVGQLCGGLNGYWNEREWFPSLVKSAEHVGCLPLVQGVSHLSPHSPHLTDSIDTAIIPGRGVDSLPGCSARHHTNAQFK